MPTPVSHANPLLGAEGRGRDPLTVPVLDLENAGLRRERARAVVSQYNRAGEHDYPTNVPLTGLRDLLCKPCTERDSWSFGGGEHVAQSTAIRQCAITSCPVWPFRTGRNPFSVRRGKTPPQFARASA